MQELLKSVHICASYEAQCGCLIFETQCISLLCIYAASPGCVAMEVGIAIPTPPDESDWMAVKQFVTSVISQLNIGHQENQIQVGVLTYRGPFILLPTTS